MVLVSFLLVLAAAVTLVVGLLQSGLGLIYVSIGCSVVAGVVLALAVLRGRSDEGAAPAMGRAAPAGAGAPPPQSWQPTAPQPEPEPVPAAATTTAWGRPDQGAPQSGSAASEVNPEAAGLADRLRRRMQEDGREADDEFAGDDDFEEASGPATQQVDMVGGDFAEDEVDPDAEMPIDDYERLRASEILAQLPGLSRRDLLVVRSHEMSNMNRFTVMSRIEAELARKSSGAGGDDDWEVDDADWEDDDDAAATPVPARRTAKAGGARSAAGASARKAAAKRAPAKKAAAGKAASRTGTAKAAAKKSAVKKSAVKAPATKATAGKAAAAKKAPAKATVKKAAAARKTTKRA